MILKLRTPPPALCRRGDDWQLERLPTTAFRFFRFRPAGGAEPAGNGKNRADVSQPTGAANLSPHGDKPRGGVYSLSRD